MGVVTVAPPPPSEPPSVEPVLASSAPTKPKRSKPYQPFSAADKVRISNLVAAGLSPAEIAARVHRGLPQISRLVRELAASAKPTSLTLQLGESKANCPEKTWAALTAAARRRNVKPASLAVEIIGGVLRHGSIDHVIRDDAVALVDDLRTVQLVLNLEAVGRANGACRDYKLRAVGLTHGERPG
jgi:hypothetical protein